MLAIFQHLPGPFTPSIAVMSPSAITETHSTPDVVIKKVTGGEDPHVHGAENLTPLQAISHGDVALPGKAIEFIESPSANI